MLKSSQTTTTTAATTTKNRFSGYDQDIHFIIVQNIYIYCVWLSRTIQWWFHEIFFFHFFSFTQRPKSPLLWSFKYILMMGVFRFNRSKYKSVFEKENKKKIGNQFHFKCIKIFFSLSFFFFFPILCLIFQYINDGNLCVCVCVRMHKNSTVVHYLNELMNSGFRILKFLWKTKLVNSNPDDKDSSLNFSLPTKKTNQFNIIDDDDNVEERCVSYCLLTPLLFNKQM